MSSTLAPILKPRAFALWRWPLPALLGWMLAWCAWGVARHLGAPTALAFVIATLAGAAMALASDGRWRRAIVAAGFPLSAAAQGLAADVPPWAWLLALAPLLLAYPLRAWRDAPFFPTPRQALQGLPAVVGTPGHVLDAGCGLGHGLAALHGLWPQARLHGVEWSPALALLTRLRCRFARVRRGDMWRGSWGAFDLVYVFQRPESMARAWRKACGEMPAGAWLVSLEFAVPGQRPWACIPAGAARSLWVYRVPGASRSITVPRGR